MKFLVSLIFRLSSSRARREYGAKKEVQHFLFIHFRGEKVHTKQIHTYSIERKRGREMPRSER